MPGLFQGVRDHERHILPAVMNLPVAQRKTVLVPDAPAAVLRRLGLLELRSIEMSQDEAHSRRRFRGFRVDRRNATAGNATRESESLEDAGRIEFRGILSGARDLEPAIDPIHRLA
ncbi:MAG: hypothetical protein WDN28_33045 [Chthoniobacter sp.]